MNDEKNTTGDDSSATPKCPNCGTSLEPGFSQCWSCGGLVGDSSSESLLIEAAPIIAISEGDDDPLVTVFADRTPMERIRRRAFVAALAWVFVFIYPVFGIFVAPIAVYSHLIMAGWARTVQRSTSYRPAVARLTAWVFLTIAAALTLIPFLAAAQNDSRHPLDDAASMLLMFGPLWALMAEMWLVIGLEQIWATGATGHDETAPNQSAS